MTRHHHFPKQAIDGRWHVVYRDPQSGALESVDDFPVHDLAAQAADQRNRRAVQTAMEAA